MILIPDIFCLSDTILEHLRYNRAVEDVERNDGSMKRPYLMSKRLWPIFVKNDFLMRRP